MIDISTSAGQEADWIRYGLVPISFVVQSKMDLPAGIAFTGFGSLIELPVSDPYVKDYDGIRGEGPTRWPRRWDVSKWGVIQACRCDIAVGGAVVVWDTPGVNMLEGRNDLAVLWDLRVHPDNRAQGIGHKLFEVAERWARKRGCVELKVETQNINVRACRFYSRQGCELRTYDPEGYTELPDEVQMLWYKEL